MGFRRVNRQNPCPICRKGDWCLVSEDGTAAICPRTEAGSIKRCGDAGWLHILQDDRSWRRARSSTARVSVRTDSPRDFGPLALFYHRQLSADRLIGLSESLGVSAFSLMRLRVGWDGRAFTFPMRDACGNVIGIRRRFLDGAKSAIRGSRSALFIPTGLTRGRRLLVCEGPTDTAAGLDLGFDAIGRPSCCGATAMAVAMARGYAEIDIIADNDDVGRQGARNLADILVLQRRVKIVHPPREIKDLRQWLSRGLVRRELDQTIADTPDVPLVIRQGADRT